ncbi:unnamed protein product [Musa acuminata subsp. burmannicoides]
MKERAEELRGQVTSMFKDTTDLLQIMELIDSIQLLGLDYHFQKEITEALSRIHDANIDDHGLYHTALWFRLLRQQGYYVSPISALSNFTGSIQNRSENERSIQVPKSKKDTSITHSAGLIYWSWGGNSEEITSKIY